MRELREKIRIERRASTPDGYGNTEGAWETVVTSRRARLVPKSGGEIVQSARLTGRAAWEMWLRSDDDTRSAAVGDRVVDERSGRVFNIRFIGDMSGKRNWLLFELEAGVADG